MDEKKIVILEDEVLISWDLKVRIERVSTCQVITYVSYREYANSLPAKGHVVFCNLRLLDGWLSQRDIGFIVNRVDRIIVFTGLAAPDYYSALSVTGILLLFKPFTSFQLKHVLRSASLYNK